MSKLFQPFSQLDTSMTRKYRGTGLGLAISRRLVELMGGEIGVESEYGKGSLFHFTVQVKVTDTSERRWAGGSGKRVLVVTPNVAANDSLRKRFLAWGFRVETATETQEGLHWVVDAHRGQDPFMLVFVDNELGEQGGLDFGHALKRHPEADGAKLVLISVTGEGVEPSTLNRAGFTFQIEKPLKHGEVLRCVRMLTGEAATDKVPTPPPKQSLVLRTSQGRSPRVLVVEDNPINQMVAQSLLERHGCQVALAGNGKEALHCLENTEYDLVLMDCEMPVMDGFETTSRIREIENGTRRLPIIAMTARAMHDDRDRCMVVGMDGYISKPIRVEQMLSEISRLI